MLIALPQLEKPVRTKSVKKNVEWVLVGIQQNDSDPRICFM